LVILGRKAHKDHKAIKESKAHKDHKVRREQQGLQVAKYLCNN
jgi:hypothetical protein